MATENSEFVEKASVLARDAVVFPACSRSRSRSFLFLTAESGDR